ncbi:gamma-aminobutyric acid type B receptor subunit 2-like [Mya arenaria]|uniref:gamma-aminobutyric acid type B receptor subunit 2-like n=1 Tax=Mya arenaria TaxID=6604 RepID=UPI0022E18395|nr:gamma-aminobutyric acid type B receptor subunit 2-like [Mya arenaria]
MESVIEAVRNNSDILPDYDFFLDVADTEGKAGLAAKQMINLIEEGPPKVAIMGPSLSDELTVTGQIAPFYNVMEISYVAQTASTVDKDLFPSLFTVNPITALLNQAALKMMKYFGWSRVGTIGTEDERSVSQLNAFHNLVQNTTNNMVLVTAAVLTDSSNVKNILATFKQFDVRIIVAAFRSSLAPAIFCEAYKMDLYGSSHVWILSGPLLYPMWITKANMSGLDCTREQLIKASGGHFTLDFHEMSQSQDIIISGNPAKQVYEDMQQKADQLGWKFTAYTPYIYDAVWSLALGLNHSQKLLSPLGLSLSDYNYSNVFLEAIKSGMKEVHFHGMSGPVSFDEQGNRIGISYIQQNFNDTTEDVASYNPENGVLTWFKPVESLWADGRIPRDSFKYQRSLVQTSGIAFGMIVVLSVIGIGITFAFLSFNVYFRNNRRIKMSSPMINNLIMGGCLILYVQVLLSALDYTHTFDEQSGTTVCMTRIWMMSVGFTILFGGMFSKTYRVYVLFRDYHCKTKVIKDIHLFGMVGILLLIDCVILIPWTLAYPLTYKRHVVQTKDISDYNVIFSSVYLSCYEARQGYWFASVYIYKGLLLAFGVFLAWETRSVQVAALNDSKYIGACIYNVVIVCIFGVPLGHVLPIEQTTLTFALESCLIVFCTTICQCIIFLPKIQTRNQVHGPFVMSTLASEDSNSQVTAITDRGRAISKVSNVNSEQNEVHLRSENAKLRMQMANEQIAIAKLRKTLLQVTGNVHVYKSGSDYVVFQRNVTPNETDT